jgi:hypothetical protein
MHLRLFLAACLATAVLVAPASAPAATKLVATVGPGFTITLTKGGKKVAKLKAGAYTITVRDRSNFHTFHLKGKGVNKNSGVSKVATLTWNVRLAKGKYTYVCDPHSSDLRGSFTVT